MAEHEYTSYQHEEYYEKKSEGSSLFSVGSNEDDAANYYVNRLVEKAESHRTEREHFV